jgi:hypothetical protein
MTKNINIPIKYPVFYTKTALIQTGERSELNVQINGSCRNKGIPLKAVG